MNHERKAFQKCSLSLHPFGLKHTVDVKKVQAMFSPIKFEPKLSLSSYYKPFQSYFKLPQKNHKILVEFVSFFFLKYFQTCSQNISGQYTGLC